MKHCAEGEKHHGRSQIDGRRGGRAWPGLRGGGWEFAAKKAGRVHPAGWTGREWTGKGAGTGYILDPDGWKGKCGETTVGRLVVVGTSQPGRGEWVLSGQGACDGSVSVVPEQSLGDCARHFQRGSGAERAKRGPSAWTTGSARPVSRKVGVTRAWNRCQRTCIGQGRGSGWGGQGSGGSGKLFGSKTAAGAYMGRKSKQQQRGEKWRREQNDTQNTTLTPRHRDTYIAVCMTGEWGGGRDSDASMRGVIFKEAGLIRWRTIVNGRPRGKSGHTYVWVKKSEARGR